MSSAPEACDGAAVESCAASAEVAAEVCAARCNEAAGEIGPSAGEADSEDCGPSSEAATVVAAFPATDAGSGRTDADADADGVSLCEIQVHNLPFNIGVKQLKVYLKRFELAPRKAITVKNHAYVTFDSEAAAASAVAKLRNVNYKGRRLKVKRTCMAAAVEHSRAKRAATESPVRKNIEDVVTPMHALSYERQLSIKYTRCLDTLLNHSAEIAKECDQPLPHSLFYGRVLPIVASPVTVGYRNKCEFTVGYKDGQPEVGFRLSQFKFGCEVEPPDRCLHVSATMKAFVRAFKAYVDASPWPPYSPENHSGVWRQIAVRSFLCDFVVVVTINPSGLSAEDIDSIKTSLLVELFLKEGTDYRLTSLFLQQMEDASSDSEAFELLEGSPYAYETVGKFRFRVSPASFFQTNSAGCAVLYRAIVDLCCSEIHDHQSAVLVDICCGTGTIALFLAEHFHRVIGIERTKAAVEDAVSNARCNHVSNCQFLCGDAEHLFEDLTHNDALLAHPFVGVLDPPRAGVSAKLIASIRNFERMQFLIYISCNQAAAVKNVIALCRRRSKRYYGQPFLLKVTVPVDMFPHTSHWETVMLFQREP